MTRRIYIQNKVLNIYRGLNSISFPIDMDTVISRYENVRVRSYQELAKATGCSIDDVVAICQSNTGCTQYDIDKNRYLILYNDDGCVQGRIRWTKAHELGHIVLGHFADVRCARYAVKNDKYGMFAEGNHPQGVLCATENQMESEADTFASIILCPFPLFREMNVYTAEDIMLTFGVSRQAAEISASQYKEWRASHRKTAWENDMRALLYADTDS